MDVKKAIDEESYEPVEPNISTENRFEALQNLREENSPLNQFYFSSKESSSTSIPSSMIKPQGRSYVVDEINIDQLRNFLGDMLESSLNPTR